MTNVMDNVYQLFGIGVPKLNPSEYDYIARIREGPISFPNPTGCPTYIIIIFISSSKFPVIGGININKLHRIFWE